MGLSHKFFFFFIKICETHFVFGDLRICVCIFFLIKICEFSPQFLVVDGCKETFFTALFVYLFYCLAVGLRIFYSEHFG